MTPGAASGVRTKLADTAKVPSHQHLDQHGRHHLHAQVPPDRYRGQPHTRGSTSPLTRPPAAPGGPDLRARSTTTTQLTQWTSKSNLVDGRSAPADGRSRPASAPSRRDRLEVGHRHQNSRAAIPKSSRPAPALPAAAVAVSGDRQQLMVIAGRRGPSGSTPRTAECSPPSPLARRSSRM